MFSNPILVTGASGQLGRLAVQSLIEAGASRIIATTRTPDRLAHLADCVEVRYADFDDPQTLVTAFAGAQSMALISTDAMGNGRRVSQHANAIAAAKAAGIAHVIYTSGLNATASPMPGMVADHAATETILAASGIRYTLLRNSFYMEMATSILGRADVEGRIAFASGSGRIGYVARQDCAEAVAAALLAADRGNRTLDITGGRSFDVPELVALAVKVQGRNLSALPVGPDALIAILVAGGTAEQMARVFALIDVGVGKGAMDTVARDFSDLTGRSQMSLEAFLREQNLNA